MIPKQQRQNAKGDDGRKIEACFQKHCFPGKISFKNTAYFLISNRVFMAFCAAFIPENLKTANCTRFNTSSVTYVGFVEINFAFGNY